MKSEPYVSLAVRNFRAVISRAVSQSTSTHSPRSGSGGSTLELNICAPLGFQAVCVVDVIVAEAPFDARPAVVDRAIPGGFNFDDLVVFYFEHELAANAAVAADGLHSLTCQARPLPSDIFG